MYAQNTPKTLENTVFYRQILSQNNPYISFHSSCHSLPKFFHDTTLEFSLLSQIPRTELPLNKKINTKFDLRVRELHLYISTILTFD